MPIRNATIQDIELIKQVRPDWITTAIINERLDKQNKKEIDFLVYDNLGQIVSFVVIYWHGKKSHPEYPDIVDLYTKESERGKGYGSMLIAECERIAKNRGFKKLGLAVNPDLNCQARKLYEKLGYHHTGNEPYVDGVYNGVKDWCIDMEKDLI